MLREEGKREEEVYYIFMFFVWASLLLVHALGCIHMLCFVGVCFPIAINITKCIKSKVVNCKNVPLSIFHL